ncbi:MAG: hypothetical protein AB7G93_07195 [Bdellovibrionales bacterium]
MDRLWPPFEYQVRLPSSVEARGRARWKELTSELQNLIGAFEEFEEKSLIKNLVHKASRDFVFEPAWN